MKILVKRGQPAIAGIYVIRNLVTGKIYVGSSIDVRERLLEHCRLLRQEKHDNKHLQASWQKHGAEAFQAEMLEIVENVHELVTREQYWIDSLNACVRGVGYNQSPTAGNQLGFRHSEESRRKGGEKRRGLKQSAETLKKRAETMKAIFADPEYRAKLSAANKGQVRTPEHSANISAAKKGKRMSDEARRNMSIASRNKKLTDEQKAIISAKISASHKGKPKSEEHCKKISATRKGKPLSQQHKDHIGDAFAKEFVVISPSGEIQKITNLRRFCLQNGLDYDCMWSIAKGRQKTHRGGWRCFHPQDYEPLTDD